ncbi:MAG: YlbF family regulator [Phycisphaeraceae bacterium]
MPSEKDILEQAGKLGKLLADHDAAKRLESATKAFENDVDSQRAMADYQRYAQTLQQKAQSGGAIEVEDKRKLETLQQAVVTNPLLANMQRAEMDYLDLLRKVDAAIVGSGAGAAEAVQPGPIASSGPSILGG